MTAARKKTLLLFLFLGIVVAVRFTGVTDILTLENLQKNRESLLRIVNDRFAASLGLYIIIYIIVVAFSIPGAAVLTLAGGFLFGTVIAVLCINVGATAGAALAFLSARYLLGARIQEKYRQQLVRFNEEMDRNGTSYLLTLRLVPVFPFFLVNFLSGLTRVPLSTFIWTTSLGIIPGSSVYAFAGHQLGAVHSLRDIFSQKVLIAFGLLALFALIPAIIKRFQKKP